MTTSSNYTVRFLRAASGPLGTAMAVEHIANFAANELERLEKEHADKIVEIDRYYYPAFRAGQRALAEVQKLKDELAGAKRTIEVQREALELRAQWAKDGDKQIRQQQEVIGRQLDMIINLRTLLQGCSR